MELTELACQCDGESESVVMEEDNTSKGEMMIVNDVMADGLLLHGSMHE